MLSAPSQCSSPGSSFNDFSLRLYEESAICSTERPCRVYAVGAYTRLLIHANRPARAPRSIASAEFKRLLARTTPWRVRHTTFRDLLLRCILLDTRFQPNLLLHRRSFGGALLRWADTDVVPLSDPTASSRPLRIDRSPPSRRTEREVNVPLPQRHACATRIIGGATSDLSASGERAEIRAPRS